MAKIPPYNYWDDVAEELYSATGRVILEIFLAGVKSGTIQLPERLTITQDWEVINQAAMDYLKQWRISTVKGITDTTRDNVIKTINSWIESGAPFDVLVSQLESPALLGLGRGKRIAVTEVTRAYASGNKTAWAATGLVGAMQWRTANDEKVCPICGPLDGKTVALDGGFALSEDELPAEMARSLARSGSDLIFYQPPAHPNCRCWLAPVVSEDLLRQKSREAVGL